jgi:hypothetical protein
VLAAAGGGGACAATLVLLVVQLLLKILFSVFLGIINPIIGKKEKSETKKPSQKSKNKYNTTKKTLQ